MVKFIARCLGHLEFHVGRKRGIGGAIDRSARLGVRTGQSVVSMHNSEPHRPSVAGLCPPKPCRSTSIDVFSQPTLRATGCSNLILGDHRIPGATRFGALALDLAVKHAMRERGRPQPRPPIASQSRRREPPDRRAWFRKASTGRCVSPRSSSTSQARARTAPAAGHPTASTARADLVARRAPCGFRVPRSAEW